MFINVRIQQGQMGHVGGRLALGEGLLAQLPCPHGDIILVTQHVDTLVVNATISGMVELNPVRLQEAGAQ
jgi:hypothetical protein